MPACDAVQLDLVTASVGSRLNGMEIDAPSVWVTEGQRGGQPVSFHQEACGLEDLAACGNSVRAHDKVKIVVLPCLASQERVDSPAPVEPGVHPGGLKRAQHG
jgi:hypothetical protein